MIIEKRPEVKAIKPKRWVTRGERERALAAYGTPLTACRSSSISWMARELEYRRWGAR
jgi:hypothetical protein